MARVQAKNDNLPAFSAGSLEAFVAWLHANKEHIRSQKIASFLAVAQKGKLRTEDAGSPSANSENIRDLGRILNTTLAVPTSDGMLLTEDGQMLASLFGQFADFVAACHGKPYQWRIGGADTAIQWLISPIIPKIYEEMSNQAGISQAGKHHQKAVKFFFRTGRTEALKTDLLNSRIHFCILRRGIIAEKLLKFDTGGAPKKKGVQLKADILGKFDYKIYVKRTFVDEAKAKAKKRILVSGMNSHSQWLAITECISKEQTNARWKIFLKMLD